MSDKPCDVEGCDKNAIARLLEINTADDRGLRCKHCLLYDVE
jgi:hypothetical protein